MTDLDKHESTRLDRAQERLRLAIDRLDAATGARLRALNLDTEKGAAELSAVRAENAELTKTHETVSKRLDAAIGRIRAVLEG